MTIVADSYRYVVGVDTHAATHSYTVIAAANGAVIDSQRFPTTPAALARAAAWIARRTGSDPTTVLVSAEGTGSYGAPLAQLLDQHGYRVVEAPSPRRPRGHGKNDQIDALTAARSTLPTEIDHLADIRSGDLRAALQTLLTARDSMCAERTRAVNALNALLRTHNLGVDARRKVSRTTITLIASWRTRTTDSLPTRTARAEAVGLATRILHLDRDVTANHHQLHQLLTQAPGTIPTLLDQPGVGPVSAAIVYTAWSHPGRVRDDAAFAKLAGVCPLEISSGNHTNHRLNRAGDRQLNRALHCIATTRMRHDPRTQAYLQRRAAEGLTKPRIRRCLKRYIARELFRTLHQQPLDTP